MFNKLQLQETLARAATPQTSFADVHNAIISVLPVYEKFAAKEAEDLNIFENALANYMHSLMDIALAKIGWIDEVEEEEPEILPKKERKKTEWSAERRQAAAERMRAMRTTQINAEKD